MPAIGRAGVSLNRPGCLGSFAGRLGFLRLLPPGVPSPIGLTAVPPGQWAGQHCIRRQSLRLCVGPKTDSAGQVRLRGRRSPPRAVRRSWLGRLQVRQNGPWPSQL